MNNSYIIVEEGGRQTRTINLEIDVPHTIGRDDENELVLRSSKVSRFHSVIHFNGKQWHINDLQSTNGILVNDIKCTTSVICDGDIIKILPFTLVIHLPLLEDDTLSNQGRENSINQDETQAEDTDRTVLSTNVAPDDGTFIEEDMTIVPDQESGACISVRSGRDEGSSISLHKKIIIGRAETCDLILTDSAISRNHIEVLRDGETYFFKNLSPGNEVSCNGKIKERGTLDDGDTLKVGNTELVVSLRSDSRGGSKIRRKKKLIYYIGFSILLILLLVVLVSLFRGRRDNLAREGKALDDHVVEKQITQKQGDGSSPTNPDELDRKKQLSLLIKEAEMLAATGLYDKAINRLEVYLKIVPDDKAILKAMDDYRGKLAVEEKKKADLIAEDNEYKKKAETDLAKASEFLMRKDYINTNEVLNKLSENKTSFPSSPEIFKKIEVIRSKVKEGQEKQGNIQEQEKRNFQTAYEEMKYSFDLGEKAYNEKKYSQAKKAWEKVAASTLDIAERTQAIAQLKKLDELFKEKTEENYNKGLSAHKSKDYKNALRYWSNVIQMYPDFKGVKTDYDAILVIQVEKSRHFYQTGLVYEGLNNLENAFSNWQKALDELPVESSEYNRKASAKLAEYGK